MKTDIGYLLEIYDSITKLESRIRISIDRRIAEAIEKGIGAKAILIAKTMGTSIPKIHGSYWVYPPVEEESFTLLPKRHKLVIIYDDYGDNLNIYWKGERVFDIHTGDVDRYKPDPEWEKELEKIYEEARKEELISKICNTVDIIKELIENWSIEYDKEFVNKIEKSICKK